MAVRNSYCNFLSVPFYFPTGTAAPRATGSSCCCYTTLLQEIQTGRSTITTKIVPCFKAFIEQHSKCVFFSIYKLTWIALKVNVLVTFLSSMKSKQFHLKQHDILMFSCSQYALYKKMTQAAILIQSKFRSYHEQKKFQQSRRAAVLIQQYYRSYKEFGKLKPHHRGAAAALVQHKLR